VEHNLETGEGIVDVVGHGSPNAEKLQAALKEKIPCPNGYKPVKIGQGETRTFLIPNYQGGFIPASETAERLHYRCNPGARVPSGN
jgi:hypothetical protein